MDAELYGVRTRKQPVAGRAWRHRGITGARQRHITEFRPLGRTQASPNAGFKRHHRSMGSWRPVSQRLVDALSVPFGVDEVDPSEGGVEPVGKFGC